MITLNIMIKELSLAVFFGLLIGFGLTGTYFFLRPNSNQAQNSPAIVTPSSSPTQTVSNPNSQANSPENSTNSVELIINSHQNYDLVSTSKITLTGHTTPQSQLIITTPSQNYTCTSDNQGNFTQNIDLEPGFNDINLTTITPSNLEKQINIYITYSTAKIE